MIQSVAFSLPGKDRNPSSSGLAKFVSFSELEPYAPTPQGMVEIGDGADGYFLIPAKAKSVTVRIKSKRRYFHLCTFDVGFSHFEMFREPVNQWPDPRYCLSEMLKNIWPIKDLTKPLSNVLSTCGVSGENAKKLIHNVIRRQLATHTDLELLRDALKVTTTKLKKETDINKAIWMTLELELRMYDNGHHGPVIWMHLGRGKTMCFYFFAPYGAYVWIFNTAGRATSEGSLILNWWDFNHRWTLPELIHKLKTVAVPFFAQPAPPWFAQRKSGARATTLSGTGESIP